MNKQDEKLYTEIEVQSLIFASQVKHYNKVEKQTEIDHDDLLQENRNLKHEVTRLKNKTKSISTPFLEQENLRLRKQNQKLLEDKKRLLNQIANINKR